MLEGQIETLHNGKVKKHKLCGRGGLWRDIAVTLKDPLTLQV